MSSDEVDMLKWPDPLPSSWGAKATTSTDGITVVYTVKNGDNFDGVIEVSFVVSGPLAATYPASARDRLLTPDAAASAQALQYVSEQTLLADPACRRLVLAPEEGDLFAIARGEAAGYRYVVDVDVPGRSLSLLTAEPSWVLEASRYLDDVPTSGS